jgi:hypothetical protein
MIEIPDSYNYISAFLTFRCSLNCNYCINKYNGLYKYEEMGFTDWVKGLNRIRSREDLPITITGGEPTLYWGLHKIIQDIDRTQYIDLLTNGEFDLIQFMGNVYPDWLKRKSKYASLRFSYHPGYTNIIRLLDRVYRLKLEGYPVGVWAVGYTIRNRLLQLLFRTFGIDFRLKEFLDKEHGTYKYPRALDGKPKKCLCKPSELLIAPDGRLFKCHYDLYHGVDSYGHILDEKIKIPDDYIPCSVMGLCNPCDIKIKNSRYQVWGHTSVEIK